MIAEESARSTAAVLETPIRPTFNAQSLAMLIERINHTPTLLEGDWRQLIGAEFNLNEEQADSLTDVTPDRVREVQDYFRAAAAHIRQGGTLAAQIVKLPVEVHTPEAVHEVRLELVPRQAAFLPQEMPTPRAFRIAHCDANCRNWRWNSL